MSVDACCGGGGGSTPTLASGSYLPTLTAVSPSIVDVQVSSPFLYQRIGDVVHVSGLMDLTVGWLAASVEWDITLPVAVISLNSCAGCLTMTSEPATNDCFGQAGVVRGNLNVARATTSTANVNNPGVYSVAVEFTYLVS